MERHRSYAEALKTGSTPPHASRTQTPKRDNTSSTQTMRFSKIIECITPVTGFLARGRDRETDLEGREADLEAKVETLRKVIRAKEKEVEKWEASAQELEQLLNDSSTANSALKRELQSLKRETKDGIQEFEQRLKSAKSEISILEPEVKKLKREKTTLEKKRRETAAQLNKAEAAGEKHRADLEEILEYSNDLCAQQQDLRVKNSNQEREIETLREANLELSAEKETLVGQLNKLTGNIARQNQRVNTSVIRDDEYFARKFADLAKDIRNWSFTHFFLHSETFIHQEVIEVLQGAIGRIAAGTNLPKIFKNRATNRRVVAGLLANELRDQIFDPLLLGLMPKKFLQFENTIEKPSTQKSPWLSQTIGLFVKTKQFRRTLDAKVYILSKDLIEMFGELMAEESDESKTSKRNQKLHAIVERAANLAVEVSQQPDQFRFITIAPGEPFDPCRMEDVETHVSLEGDDPDTCGDDCRVSLSVFPCVHRQRRIENDVETIMINRAWVTVETGDNDMDIEEGDGDIADKEADGGVEFGGMCSSGQGQDGGEIGAQREGSEDSPDWDMTAAEKDILPGSSNSELQEEINEEVDLDLCEKMEMIL